MMDATRAIAAISGQRSFVRSGVARNGRVCYTQCGASGGGNEGVAVERGTGTVTFYDPQRNFGFIAPNDGGADVIFYLRDGDQQVDIGDTVSFELSQRMSVTEVGRQAIRVTRTGFPVAVS